MAIVSVPEDAGISDMVGCIVCGQQLPLGLATAGLRDVNGRQTFACNAHFKGAKKCFVGWVDFVAAQRMAHVYDETLNGVGEKDFAYAWAIY